MNIIVTTQTQFKPQTLLPDLTSFGFDTNIGLPTHITLYKIGRPICGQSFLLPADRTLGIDNFESKMIGHQRPIIFDSNLSLPSVRSAGSKNDWPRIGQTFTEYL